MTNRDFILYLRAEIQKTFPDLCQEMYSKQFEWIAAIDNQLKETKEKV